MNNNTYIVWDTETTGLHIGYHEVIQIAAKAYNPKTLEPIPNGEFQIFLKPDHPEHAEEYVVNNVIGKDVFEKVKKDGIDQRVGWKAFFDWCKTFNKTGHGSNKPIPVGHNMPGFDMLWAHDAVVRYKYGKSSEDLPLSNRALDTWAMFFSLYESDPEVKSYSMDSLVTVTGGAARSKKEHDAMEDVRICGDRFVRFMKMYRTVKTKLKIRE